MNPNDFPLLLSLVYTHGGVIHGRKRFQKLVCIMKYGNHIPFSFRFIPYHYGPYSEDLAGVIDRLVGLGLLEEEKSMINDFIIQYSYSLTSEGSRMAQSIVNLLGETDQNFLDRFTDSVQGLKETDIAELVRLSKEAFNSEQSQVIYQH